MMTSDTFPFGTSDFQEQNRSKITPPGLTTRLHQSSGPSDLASRMDLFTRARVSHGFQEQTSTWRIPLAVRLRLPSERATEDFGISKTFRGPVLRCHSGSAMIPTVWTQRLVETMQELCGDHPSFLEPENST